MFTPAINASSTSAPPCVIMVKAFCTQVMSPPFLNLLPLADAITTGLIDFEFMIVGDCAKNARGAIATVKPATALERTKRRLFILHPITGGRGKATRNLRFGKFKSAASFHRIGGLIKDVGEGFVVHEAVSCQYSAISDKQLSYGTLLRIG